jgi:protein TonB
MMLLAAGHNWRPDHGPGRWIGAAIAILLLHGGAVAAGLITWQSFTPPVPPPAAIMMELMPVPMAPPAPETQANVEERLPEPEPLPMSEPEPEPEPLPQPVVEVPLPAPLPLDELPLALRTPEVELPKPAPEKPKLEKKAEEKPKEKPKDKPKEKPKDKPKDKPQQVAKKDEEKQVQPDKTPPAPAQIASVAAAPVQPAQMAAAPSAADIARRQTAEANWQGMLLAHLEKFKRYPKSAQRRNQQGAPQLRVKMDRNGYVLSFSLERSSGHESLDDEVLALAERAAPLPALPPEMTQSTIEIVVPVNFNLSN